MSVQTLRPTLPRCIATFSAELSTRCVRMTVEADRPAASICPYIPSTCSGCSLPSRCAPMLGVTCNRTVAR
jgi:hypothetical protein